MFYVAVNDNVNYVINGQNKTLVVNSNTKASNMGYKIDIVILLFIVGLYFFNYLIALICAFTYIIYRTSIHFVSKKYFSSDIYKRKVRSVKVHVKRHNHVARSMKQLPSFFELYPTQDMAKKHINQHSNIVNVSLSVLRNVETDPVGYVIKYFNIDINNWSLSRLRTLYYNIHLLQKGQNILNNEKRKINQLFNHPWYINVYYLNKAHDDLGLYNPYIEVSFDQYIFRYRSPKGQSKHQFIIDFDEWLIKQMYFYMDNTIKYRKTAKYQRSLMTESLRKEILERDNYTCQNPLCGRSQHLEPDLILEIDHIIPVSKGGKTVRKNLQVLCRSCNRSKSNKII